MMNIENIFGHYLFAKVFHKIGPNGYPFCGQNSSELFCKTCSINADYKDICKKCFKMLSKKEQEELVHYFCVRRLKQ